ncbi:MAG TPA: DHA2 family efflux MFS transporter permease subunit [Chloroflexota bacterium]
MTDHAPPRKPQTSLSTPRIPVNPWITLIVVSLGFFMILLDTTIVNVAIPSIITDLHASLDQILWVLSGYILVYAVLLITTGRLGDMYGPKKLFLSGLALFTLASAACGLAQSPEQLIIFRVIQGVGGALLTPQSMSIITSIFPPEKRGAAFGVWGAVAGLAAVTGPTLGGFLTTTFSWRAIFYVNVPIGIAAIVLATLVMPELTNHRKHHLDIPGVALASSGLFIGVFALIESEKFNWGRIWNVGAINIGPVEAGPVSVLSLLLLSVVILAVFVTLEVRADEPLLPISLFHDRNFSIANGVSALVAFGMLGLFLPLSIFLQSVLGLDALHAGFVLVPTSLTSLLISPFAGRLTDRVNGKFILFTGLVLFAAGMGMVVWVASLTSTGTSFTLPLIVAGVGMGCTFAPMVTLAMRHVRPEQAGTASGFINTVRQVGGAVGNAVVGAVLQHQLASELKSQASRAAAQLPLQIRGRFVSGFSHAASGGFQVGRGENSGNLPKNLPAGLAHHLQIVGHEVFQQAFLNAMKPALLVPITILLVGSFSTLFMDTPPVVRQEQKQDARGESRIAAAGQ